MNVVIFCPKFFGYDLAIKKEIEKRGNDVILFDERPSNSIVSKVIFRMGLKKILDNKLERYYQNIYLEVIKFKPQKIVLIDVEVIPVSFLQRLRSVFPNLIIILYQWDSFKNKPHFKNILQFVDRGYTFEPEDAITFTKLEFFPLFFEREFVLKGIDCRYDLSFLGSLHSDRYPIVRQFIKYCNLTGLSFFKFIYSHNWFVLLSRFIIILYKYNVFITEHKIISFSPLTKKEAYEIYSKSKVVLDINHPGQVGLTSRTFEALASGAKLITTNTHIKDYPFYSEKWVYILKNRKFDDSLSRKFFNNLSAKDKIELENAMVPYSLDLWVSRLMSD